MSVFRHCGDGDLLLEATPALASGASVSWKEVSVHEIASPCRLATVDTGYGGNHADI
jgi:hypothetical protein